MIEFSVEEVIWSDEVQRALASDIPKTGLLKRLMDSPEPVCDQGSCEVDEVSEVLEEAVRKVLFGRVLNG